MPGWSKRPLFKNPTMMVGGGYVGMPKGMSIPGYQDGSLIGKGGMLFDPTDPTDVALLGLGMAPIPGARVAAGAGKLGKMSRKLKKSFEPGGVGELAAVATGSSAPFLYMASMLDRSRKEAREGTEGKTIEQLIEDKNRKAFIKQLIEDTKQQEKPDERLEQLGKETEYQKTIEKIAGLFSSSDPNRPRLLRDYESNLHWYAKNIAGGHQVPKEQVMQDLMKAIEAQRSAPEMKTGGIVGLENGGIMPKLFEGEEIVETNPTINAMAAQGGGLSAEALPEAAVRGVPSAPNERGIVSMAVEAEELAEELAEEDNPIVAAAKQEAKEKLRLEFDIVKSTAAADAAQGRDPSFIIKESMDNLARSAKNIEQETVEKYPEIPLNTDLLNSQDLEPYQQELVSVFEMPAQNEEIPLEKDSIVMAKNGGLIPGYQDGDVVLPPEWAWIDQEFIDAGLSLEQAEAEMIKKHGPTILKMREFYGGRETESEKKKRYRSLSSQEVLEEMRQERDDPRRSNLLRAMGEVDFMGSTKPTFLESLPFAQPRTGEGIERMSDELNKRYIKENIELLREYNRTFDDEGKLKPPPPELEEIVVTAQKRNETGPELDQAIAAYTEAINSGTETPAWAKKIIRDNLQKSSENNEEETSVDSPETLSPSSSTANLLQMIKELGATMETGIDTAKTDVKKRAKDLTEVYDIEVQKSTDAVNAANTSINNALTSYEKRIPELARLIGLRSPGTAIFQKQNAAREAEIRMRNGVDDTKMELGKLEKELQEARRENNLAASRDIKARQLDAISRLNELAIEQGVDLKMQTTMKLLEHEMRLDEIRMQAELAQTNTGVNQQLISAMNDLKARITSETDPDAKALLESELDTYRTVVLGQKSPQAQITTALLEGNYKELFSAYSVEDMQRYAPSLQGEKTIQIEGIPQPLTGSFPDFYNYMVSKKKPNKEVYYTDKEIVEMWKRGKG